MIVLKDMRVYISPPRITFRLWVTLSYFMGVFIYIFFVVHCGITFTGNYFWNEPYRKKRNAGTYKKEQLGGRTHMEGNSDWWDRTHGTHKITEPLACNRQPVRIYIAPALSFSYKGYCFPLGWFTLISLPSSLLIFSCQIIQDYGDKGFHLWDYSNVSPFEDNVSCASQENVR